MWKAIVRMVNFPPKIFGGLTHALNGILKLPNLKKIPAV